MACFQIQITGDNPGYDWAILPIEIDVDLESQPVMEDDAPDIFSGQYTDDLVFNVTFPNTQKNYKLLGGLLSGSNYKMERREVNIVAVYNGEVMYVDKMYAVRNGFNNDGRFEVQLIKSKSWVKLASDKKIKDIDFVGFPIQQNSANIETFNSFGAKWNDGEIPVRFPLILRNDRLFTGRNIYDTPIKHFITESDLIPYVSLLALLRKGFSDIGWSFECPFLESDAGRRIWVDLTADILPFNNSPRIPLEINGGVAFYGVSLGGNLTFSEFPMFGNRKNFTINGQVIILQGTTDLEDSQPTTDNSPWFINNKYTEPVVIDISVYMRVKRISPVPNSLFKGDVEVEVRLGTNVIYTHSDLITDQNIEISFTVPEIEVNEREFLNFVFKMRPTTGGWVQVTDILVKETKLHYRFLNKAHLYKVNELFQPTDTLFDLLKGFAQMIFGKIDKDEERRKLRLLSPLDFEIFEEQIEGYYKSETSTLTNIARMEVNSNDDERKRYMQLAFAESNDKVIKEAYPDDDKYLEQFSLHGTFIDFGDKYEKSVEPFINKYFVPTYTPENTYHLCPISGFEENTYKNKGRRIVFALGEVSIAKRQRTEAGQVVDPARNIKVGFWERGAEQVNPFWAFQSINEGIYTLPVDSKFFHLAFSTKKIYTDFVDQYKNLYDLICKDYIINLITSQGGTVWKYMKSSEFSNFDKRKQYVFSIKDQTITCKITKIEGYRPCEEDVVGLTFLIGDKFRISPTATSTPPTNDKPYDPDLDFSIDVQKVDCTYFITLNYGL
jgi:hypothetical protein